MQHRKGADGEREVAGLLAKMEKDKGGYAGNYATATVDGASPYARTLEAANC